jgi:nitrite reductase/ring-hydroxylating ferredoxin subunit
MLEDVIFDSEALAEKSVGLRFSLPMLGEHVTGFVVRFEGKAYAYVNQCAHVSVELDWNEGEFFTTSKDYLICSTHGAHYAPNNGYCVYGPCKGKRLRTIPVTEAEQKIMIHIQQLNETAD